MIVMKFGGVSVGDAAAIRRLTEIVRERLDRRPVLVVSAMGKTTRRLLMAAGHAADGNVESAKHLLGELQQYHREIACQVIDNFDASEARKQLDGFFEQITETI